MIGNDAPLRNVLAPLQPPEPALAFRDDLTGLYNARLLTSLLDERWDEMAGLCDKLALVLIDLDLFKQVNDRYGHLSGDDVLRTTADLLRTHFRKGDMIFRYGGDEFIVLLPGVDADEAKRLGERARDAMRSHEFFTPEERVRIRVPLSFSVGVASWPVESAVRRALLARADERLYAEKKANAARARMRRRIVWWFAAGFGAAMVMSAIVMTMDDRPIVVAPMPHPTVRTRTANDEELRLEIATLQAKIDQLTRERSQQSDPQPDQRAVEIQKLQAQIGDLNARLEAKPSPKPAPLPPPQQAAVVSPSPAQPVESPPQRPAEVVAIVPPQLLVPPVPRYPAMARDRRIEATIELRVTVDERGRVTHAELMGQPRGYGLEEAARTAAMESRWQPATRGGIPFALDTTLRVEFKIAR